MKANRITLEYLSSYLEGQADGAKNDRAERNFRAASEILKKFAPWVCGQGFVCNVGDNCTSDHK